MKEQFRTTAEALAEFPKRRYVVLAPPRIDEEIPNVRITATVVPVKPNGNYVYWNEAKEGWVLNKHGLLELAMGAGIKFGTTTVSYDPEKSPIATLIARRQIAPGEWVEVPGTYALNRENRKAGMTSILAEAEKDAEFDRAELEQMKKDFAAQMIGLDRYGEQMSETGAMLRAIRALLGIEHVYSAKQLRKQFVVMRLELVADEEAVKVAQGLLALQVGDLFGEGSVAPPLDPQVRRVAEALLAKVLPTEPPKVEVEAPRGDGIGEYERQLIAMRKSLFEAGVKHGVSDTEIIKKARALYGETLWRLKLSQLQELYGKLFGRLELKEGPLRVAQATGGDNIIKEG